VGKENTILVMSDYYLPGFKSGGSARTIANIIDQLGNEVTFKVVTRDCDLGDSVPYQNILYNKWNQVGKAQVYYLPRNKITSSIIKEIIGITHHSVLYLNSFFSLYFTIYPLLLRFFRILSQKTPIIIAPRGELATSALSIKSLKKKMFIKAVQVLGLYRSVIWQASSVYEENDIRRLFGQTPIVRVVPDMPPQVNVSNLNTPRKEKIPGNLSIIFLSRIARVKNLDGALSILSSIKGNISFNIYGPIEDSAYWKECNKIILKMPSNIKVYYHGEISHDKVYDTLRLHDLFFSPTNGENFGNAILEALLAGCPVVISNRTPWRELHKKGIGWDIPLESPEFFGRIIQEMINMDRVAFDELSGNAFRFALQFIQDTELLEINRQLFARNLKGQYEPSPVKHDTVNREEIF